MPSEKTLSVELTAFAFGKSTNKTAARGPPLLITLLSEDKDRLTPLSTATKAEVKGKESAFSSTITTTESISLKSKSGSAKSTASCMNRR